MYDGYYVEPGGLDINPERVNLHPIDADGNDLEVPEVGDMWPISTTGRGGPIDVEVKVESVTPGSYYQIYFSPIQMDFLDIVYDADVFLGSQEPTGSALFAGEINVESMFVGDTPVSAAYVGNAQVYPSKVVPDYKMEVKKVPRSWEDDGKYYIDYQITNTGKEPMFVSAEVLRATGQEVAPGDTYTATFYAIEPGTYDIAITARTINDYVFDVYEEEVVVPGKEPLNVWKYNLGSSYCPDQQAAFDFSRIYFSPTDLDNKVVAMNVGCVYEYEILETGDKHRVRATGITKMQNSETCKYDRLDAYSFDGGDNPLEGFNKSNKTLIVKELP